MSSFIKRIGLIGDIHAEYETLCAALNFLEGAQVDHILSVGDIADGHGSLDRCCEVLAKHNVVVVAGNHERWLLADEMRSLPNAHVQFRLKKSTVEFIQQLPSQIEIETPCGIALLCHGLGLNDMAGVKPTDDGYELDNNTDLKRLIREPSIRLVFNGHTHRSMVRHFPGLTVVNAGTLLRGRDPGFLIVDFLSETVTEMEFHSPTDIRAGKEMALRP